MSLDSLKRNNSLDKLLGEVKKENAPQEKKSYNCLLYTSDAADDLRV